MVTGHTVVIGAGPAGLAAAVCMKRRNQPYLVLDRGDRPLAALRRVAPTTTLLSPTRLSRLPDMREADGAPPYLHFDQLVDMLDRYRQRHDIHVDTGVEVERVEHAERVFQVHCRGGRVESCAHVINATGMISHGHVPASFDPGACTIPWLHSIDVRSADLARAQSLLVIGAGTSAAEVFESWLPVRAPGARGYISLRSRLRSVPHRLLGVDVHYLAWLPEHLPAHIPGVRRLFHRDPVIGSDLARAIRGGLVEPVPAVKTYAHADVELVDGRRVRPDLMVFATGFRYAAPHLGALVDRDEDGVPRVRACESARTPGLYLLGLRFGRSLASSYLRGIARDAAHVAACIARRGRS